VDQRSCVTARGPSEVSDATRLHSDVPVLCLKTKGRDGTD
jgi:hypothetical protein